MSDGSEDNRPASDPAQEEQSISIFVTTALWLALLHGRSETLTFSQVDQYPEVLIFQNQIDEIRRSFADKPDRVNPFNERLKAFFIVTPSCDSILTVYSDWTVVCFEPPTEPNAGWFFRELWQNLSMESRYFLAKIRATNRANALLTDDPIEREFAKLMRLYVP